MPPQKSGHKLSITIFSTQAFNLIEPLRKLLTPISLLFEPQGSFWTRFYCLILIVWFLLVWGFIGGVISRMAVLSFTGKEGGGIRAYSSETANVYGLAGGRFAWFWEQLKWRTTALDVNGNGTPSWTADYSNVLSQRMYGPFAGAGSDVYLGHGFSANFDATGALLLDFVKTIPKYWLEDLSIAKKVTRNSYEVVPNVNLGVNLLWNPFKNVQVRVGYQAMLFFNTKYMATPIDFNYGSLDPGYSNYFLRVVQGLNVGVGFMF